MAILERYQTGIQHGHFLADVHQTPVVDALHKLAARLIQGHGQSCSLFGRILLQGAEKKTGVASRGLYIWGGVGRGKTWLMDEFLKDLSMIHVRRFHFHEFMQAVHQSLHQLATRRDPLTLVPQQLFGGVELICIDEFQVSDITDAMILHGLITALFKQRITLVITSNIAPEELYKNGLQRERFLPTIGLLQSSLQVLHLQGTQDYRAVHPQNNGQLFIPTSKRQADTQLGHAYSSVTHGRWDNAINLPVIGRTIHCLRHHPRAVWFEFNELCGTARATHDYIHIAQQFEQVFISDIPILDNYQEDMAKRLNNLIDELYDHHCQLYASMDAEPSQIYRGRLLHFEFQRTVSRLQEMGTTRYAQGAHLSNRNAGKTITIKTV